MKGCICILVFGVSLISIKPPPLNLEKHLNLLSNIRPRSAPALELVFLPRSGEPHISRATLSVGVMYHFSGPNTGGNPGGGWILKNNKKKHKRVNKQ